MNRTARLILAFCLTLGGLIVAPSTALALDNSVHGNDDVSMDDLKKKGYECEYVSTNFWECEKAGEKTYWCSNRGQTCVPKPLIRRPSRFQAPLFDSPMLVTLR